MGNLLGGGTVLSDRSELLERWNQEGSTIKNISFNNVSDDTVYTVTSGKKLYIKFAYLQSASGSTGLAISLLDGGSSGTQKFIGETVALKGTISIEFPTPLEFDTDVYVDCNSVFYVTLTGWEE